MTVQFVFEVHRVCTDEALFGGSGQRFEPRLAPRVQQRSASVSWHAGPVVSFVSEANIAVTAGWITVSGLDFGFVDATPTSGLGLTSCVTSAWASVTSAVCFVGPGNVPLTDVLVSVATVVGTQTSAFSYDGMRVVSWQRFGLGLGKLMRPFFQHLW